MKLHRIVPLISLIFPLLFGFCHSTGTSVNEFSSKIVAVDNESSLYEVALQIRLENQKEAELGNFTYRFRYNREQLSFPGMPEKSRDYNFSISDSGQYKYSVTQPAPGVISVNIFYKGGNPARITGNYTNIVNVKFRKEEGADVYRFDPVLVELFSPGSSLEWKFVNTM